MFKVFFRGMALASAIVLATQSSGFSCSTCNGLLSEGLKTKYNVASSLDESSSYNEIQSKTYEQLESEQKSGSSGTSAGGSYLGKIAVNFAKQKGWEDMKSKQVASTDFFSVYSTESSNKKDASQLQYYPDYLAQAYLACVAKSCLGLIAWPQEEPKLNSNFQVTLRWIDPPGMNLGPIQIATLATDPEKLELVTVPGNPTPPFALESGQTVSFVFKRKSAEEAVININSEKHGNAAVAIPAIARIAQFHDAQKEVKISSNDNWKDTGIAVVAGKGIRFRPWNNNWTVQVQTENPCLSDGYNDASVQPRQEARVQNFTKVSANHKLGALLAKVGDEIYGVGPTSETPGDFWYPTQSGQLKMMINDDIRDLGNNANAITCEIFFQERD